MPVRIRYLNSGGYYNEIAVEIKEKRSKTFICRELQDNKLVTIKCKDIDTITEIKVNNHEKD